MKSRTNADLGLAVFAGIAAVASTARAEAPEGIMSQNPASAGATDVGGGGFEAPVPPPEGSKDATELEISAGSLISAGNSRSLSLTGAGNFRRRRAADQVTATAAGNFGRAASDPDSDTETNVENYQGKVRYDRFIAGPLAAFLAVTARRDRFQGLDLRLNLDPGIALYFVDQEKHRLWGEAGYDFQYDVRSDENITAAAADGAVVDKTEIRHSARLFGGYDNKLNEEVTFNTGLEYLQSVEESEDWRLNWDVGLTSSIADSLSIATTLSLKYDNNPLPGVEELDVISAFSLVYTLL